jgi:hypothetical protein
LQRRRPSERAANDNPRLSLKDRYRTSETYVNAVRTAANELKAQRLLREEDVQAYVQRADASNIGR